MAEQSGFFADINGDRQYTTDFLADWVSSFISNGVYNGELAVTAGDGMTVKIPIGRAWINGYYYHNDSELTLAIANADGVLARKDTVVLRWDVNARNITAQVLTGTFASNPVAPEIVRTAEVYDLKLAEIYIPAGTTKITQSLITDCRLDNEVCGIVHAVIDQIDTSTLMTQLDSWVGQYKSNKSAEFTAWFEAVKGQLSTDAAGNLQNQIDSIITGDTSVGNAVKADVANSALPDSELDSILQTGWIPIKYPCTYISATSFQITGDVTGKLSPGDKITLTQSTGTKYFYVEKMSMSNNITTVTIAKNSNYKLDNDTISLVYYTKVNSSGWSGWSEYVPTITCGGAMTYTGVTISRAYFRMFEKAVWLDIRTDGTIGGTPSGYTYISLPVNTNYGAQLYGALRNLDTSTAKLCYCTITEGQILLSSYDSPFPTGNVQLSVFGLYRIA